MALTRTFISSNIAEPVPLGAVVTVIFLVIGKMTLAERPFLFMQCLPLRRDYHFDALGVNLLKLIGISISRIGTGGLTGFCKQFICLF